MRSRLLFSTIVYFIFSHLAYGLSDSLKIVEDTIFLTSTKLKGSLDKSSQSISYVKVDPSFSNNISIQEHINQVPGLFALNAQNYAQDLRVSIRGFGSRSSFGIRGVKLIVDGIPETTPDGQGQVDNLNLGLIDNIEVIKGSASVLYGNASGGVININTIDQYENGRLNGNITMGSYGLKRYDLGYATQFNKTKFLINGNHVLGDGYRNHSSFKSTNGQIKVAHQFSDNLVLKLNTAYTDSPVAQDPGGIKISQVEEDRTSASSRNVQFNAGESISQFKAGSSLSYIVNNKSQLNAFAYVSERKFDGFLPFDFGGAIDLDRTYWGQGTDYSIKSVFEKSINTIKLGYELAGQSDDRIRFVNNDGVKGDTTLNQNESFNNQAFFILNKLSTGNWIFDLGLRYDINTISIKSEEIDERISLNSLNPSIGVNYTFLEFYNLFANYRTGFETPVLNELTSTIDGENLNVNLKPQRSRNFEIGLRTNMSNRLTMDLTYFKIVTFDELVPFRTSETNPRTFYQNAGKTNRSGFEFSGRYKMTNSLSISGNLTISDLKFDEFLQFGNDLKGTKIPGVPQTYGGLTLLGDFESGFGFELSNNYRGEFTLSTSDDINMEESVFIMNLKLKYTIGFTNFNVEPYVSINNLTNALYSDNIRINSSFLNYYEPAPERNFLIGIRFNI